MSNYALHLAIIVGIYSLLAYSMNLVTGYGGLLPFCHAAFYGIGAYTYALLQVGAVSSGPASELLFAASWPYSLAMLATVVTGAAAALLVGAVSLRFRGDFFVFATLSVQMTIFLVLYNWTGLSRGVFGIYGIPRPRLFSWHIRELWEYAILVALANGIVLPLLFRLYNSPFGLALKALRDNERAAESLGISAFRHHLCGLVIAGACAALAGGLFASYVTYIDPTSFHLRESIFIVSLLLLGGTGNRRGPILGVLAMILLPEAMRFVGMPDAIAANVREMIYGLALILLMYWRPWGIAGSYGLR